MTYLFRARQRPLKTPFTWFYNPIHDLESVWWLFAWSTLNRDIYFIHPIPKTTSNAIVPGVVTRSRQRALRTLPGNDIDADDDQVVPAGFTQETRATRVRRVKRQHALALTLFVGQHVEKSRIPIIVAEGTLNDEVARKELLHPVIRICGEYLCTSRDLLADSYKKAEVSLAQLPKNANSVADRLHDQFKDLFDKANKYIGGLGVEISVRKLSTEHTGILGAEKLAQDRWEAAHAAELAQLRAEGAYRMFVAPKAKNEGSTKDALQPTSRRGKKSVDFRNHAHALSSVPEDLEIDTGSEPRPGPSTLLPSRTARAVLPPVPEEEEGVTTGQRLARTDRKRKQVDRDDAEVAATGPSRPTRASTRRNLALTAGSSAKPPPRQHSRRAPAHVTKVVPPLNRKRATPTAHSAAPVPVPIRPSRPQENAHALGTARAGEEPEEAARPSKKRRVEAEPNPKPGGRVLRPSRRP